jgi:hypothetical protein
MLTGGPEAERNAPSFGGDDVRPPLSALFRQLGDDAKGFAQAEAAMVKARLGEGWSHAVPALAAIGIAISILFGAFIALPLGIMVALGHEIGFALAIPLVMLVTAMLGYGLIRWGASRLKASLKLPEDRK